MFLMGVHLSRCCSWWNGCGKYAGLNFKGLRCGRPTSLMTRICTGRVMAMSTTGGWLSAQSGRIITSRFATVPLDTWFTHPQVAKLFKRQERRISLSIHGNDHIREELARTYTEQQRTALLKQSISRIERLERKTGLRVCRVMVPPHGACSAEMLGAIGNNGFEAASISHGSLGVYNER